MTKATFENSIKDLEKIVGDLEQGELSLDEAMKVFEEGNKLVKTCRKQLEEAEMKVEKILNEQGETAPFEGA